MDDRIAQLYRLPLDQFTPARNALAKEAGPRAAEIKTLEKPNAAAWAVNQLFWRERAIYDELIETSSALRAAYRDQLAGQSPDVRGAEAAHKAAVKRATQSARALVEADGSKASDAVMQSVRETLDILPSGDPPGRLTRPLKRSGFEALEGFTIAAKPRPVPIRLEPRAPGAAKPTDSEKQAREAAERERDMTRERLRFAEAAEREAEAALERARRAAERAGRTRERIQGELDEATKSEKTLTAEQDAAETAHGKAVAERERLAKLLAVALGMLLLAVAAAGGAGAPVPFAWFEPDATVSPAEFARMSRGEIIVKPLPSRTQQLGVFAATEIGTSPEVFVEWIRHISQLQRSQAVAASGRFSEPPAFQDLDGLVLDARDLEAIRECRPGRCALKLSPAEIQSLRSVTNGGADAAVQYAFRRVLFERLMADRRGGAAAAPAGVLAALQANSPYIGKSDARLAQWLNAPERAHGPEVESFYYWSKEYYASGKAVIALTQVGVTRAARGAAAPEVAVVGKQLFASRYMTGMLTHITLARHATTGALYMTYTNRAQLDVLKGFWGGLVRAVINSRLRGDAASVLRTLRDRIESGPPSPGYGGQAR